MKASIARLIEVPRPARALPKPSSAARAPALVSLSKIAVKSSISPAFSRALRSGMVSPAWKPCFDVPELSSTWGYPAVLTGMFFICYMMYRRFKQSDWL